MKSATLIESTELSLIFLIPVFLLAHCYFLSCYLFSYLPTVSIFLSLYSYCYPNELLPFFLFLFFPLVHCYFLSCYFFSYLSTVTFFPVTFFPVTFFPTWNCYFLSCYLFSCYFLSVHRTGLCIFSLYLEFTALQWMPVLLLTHVSTSTLLCACLWYEHHYSFCVFGVASQMKSV